MSERERLCEVCGATAAQVFRDEEAGAVWLCEADYRSAVKDGLYWINLDAVPPYRPNRAARRADRRAARQKGR